MYSSTFPACQSKNVEINFIQFCVNSIEYIGSKPRIFKFPLSLAIQEAISKFHYDWYLNLVQVSSASKLHTFNSAYFLVEMIRRSVETEFNQLTNCTHSRKCSQCSLLCSKCLFETNVLHVKLKKEKISEKLEC